MHPIRHKIQWSISSGKASHPRKGPVSKAANLGLFYSDGPFQLQ